VDERLEAMNSTVFNEFINPNKVRRLCSRLKKNASPGPDGITAEHLTHAQSDARRIRCCKRKFFMGEINEELFKYYLKYQNNNI
jgi:hypothetical protein